MKKKNIIFAMLAMLSSANLCVNATPVLVPLQVDYIDPTNGDGDPHRGPVFIPNLSIDERTLLIPEALYNCELRLVDESGVVVYSTVIPVGCEELELPASLSGEFEIRLLTGGTFYFYGYITL